MAATTSEVKVILTKKQQKAAINAKKKGSGKSLRNVITLPFDKYWPLVAEQDCVSLKEMLEKFLVKLRLNSEKLPISAFKFSSADEAKEMKKSALYDKKKTPAHQEALEMRKLVLLGSNAVIRGINGAGAVLLSSDLSPLILANSLIQTAVASKVPVILVPSFRQLCTATMGFATMALGLKISRENEELTALIQKVTQISSQFEIPQYLQQLPAVQDIRTKAVVCAKKVGTRSVAPPQVDVGKLHLLRPSPGKRAFIPGKSGVSQVSSDSSDFISLGETNLGEVRMDTDQPVLSLRGTTSKVKSYKPVIVKRMQPNSKKVKKKKNKKTAK